MTNRPSKPTRRPVWRAAVLALAPLASLVAAPAAAGAQETPASADRRPPLNICDRIVNDTYLRLLTCTNARGVTEHLRALQDIATANGGTRAAATPGYDASADYVADQLTRAGYEVERQEFPFPFFEELAPATLAQVTPTPTDYETGTYQFSGSGVVEGTTVPVDINLEGDRASTSGCEVEDFAGVDLSGPSDVVVVQRGSCDFGVKAQNAQDAGAEAVVIFNQGNDPGRLDLFIGTLGEPRAGTITIPVVGASFDDGAALSAPGVTARVTTETFVEIRSTENVIAQSRRGRDDNVVMSGAHLDSVTEGPGINDNGSGSAALLEVALNMARVRPENSVRFAWWGAEESGTIGSDRYVAGLSEEEVADIALYMNYDMVASPNYVQTVYDADESTFPAAEFGVVVPEGSTAIEDLYERFYTRQREPYDDTAFSGRSDYAAFIAADIPSSGLFTGAEEVKTAQQQEIWGGTAGEAFDPCYHQACDDIGNVNQEALDTNADVIAFATLTFAYSTQSVNGERGRRVPGLPFHLPRPAGPEGTFAGSGGAGPSNLT